VNYRIGKQLVPLATVLSLSIPFSANATNGMNLEGYGPIAHSMGGASMAYDNGTAAVMNNPATLGLMEQGNRLDVSLGFLGPNVTAKAPGAPDAKSSADAFYMPALGWAQKRNQLTYGVGVFSQGGMGTEYDANSFMAAGSGETVRSEVGVGRLIAPLTYNVNSQWTIGGSLDFVWAGMDIKMAMPGSAFGDMVADFGGSQTYGTASGSMVEGLLQFVQGQILNSGQGTGDGFQTGAVNWARFDFSNSSAFTGEATGTGFAGKIGGVFKLNSIWSFGATYHTKTSLDDLESSNATISMSANVNDNLLNGTWDGGTNGSPATSYTATKIPLSGKIIVKDFQWPATLGVGAAGKFDKWMVAADIKQIFWKDVMKDFKMTFIADASQSNPLAAGFAGTQIDAVLFQEWKDQTVLEVGAGYMVTEKTTLRFGFNYGENPVPDKYLNALFPAIVKNHLTGGIGYDIDKNSGVNFSLVYAPEVEATSGQGVTSTHSQINWQLMYSYVF
jgi:long-chain fatty acid transport protein